VVLLLIAAVIKVETTFSFIPFHKFDSLLTRQIKFKWGWFVLFAGPVLALGRRVKRQAQKLCGTARNGLNKTKLFLKCLLLFAFT
jgi:hypothetical protein